MSRRNNRPNEANGSKKDALSWNPQIPCVQEPAQEKFSIYGHRSKHHQSNLDSFVMEKPSKKKEDLLNSSIHVRILFVVVVVDIGRTRSKSVISNKGCGRNDV